MSIRIKEHSPWKTQLFVTKALFKREIVTRFGKYKLGALWMLIDPLVSVLVIGLLLGPLLGRSAGDIPYAFFLLCGFMQLKLFTGPLNCGISAVKSNQGLLVFKQVQALDPFIARFFFEFITTLLAFTFFCIAGAWFGIPLYAGELGFLFLCFLLTWLMGCGFGLVLGVWCHKFKELEKVQAYIQRPLLFVSCVLYSSATLPPEQAKYILYNPLAHTIEYTRVCLFPNYKTAELNLYLPAAVALIALAFGLMIYRNNRHFLSQR